MRGVLVAAALLAGCGDRSRAPSRPVAMTIKTIAPAETPAVNVATDQEPPETPLQLAFAMNRLCVRMDGRVYCQPIGRSADGPIVQEANRVDGIDDATDLSGGRTVLCAVTRRGTVMCFGSNTYGELGHRSEHERSEKFVEVVGLARARRVGVGANHVCAVLDDKSVMCWGRNESGQTGGDTNYQQQARQLVKPNLVPNVKGDQVLAGSASSCAHTMERHVVCWGLAQDQTGARKSGVHQNERATRVTDLDDVTSIAARDDGYCAIRRGQILCWGQARHLIPGTDYFGAGTVSVSGVKDAQQLALGESHGCLLHSDGRVSCFGYPYTGALGRPTNPDSQGQYDAVPPAIVEGLPRAKAVVAGGTQSCLLSTSNDLFCWGRRYDEYGAHDEPKPIQLPLR